MTNRIRLEDANQTTLIYIDADYVAVHVCHGDPGAEDVTTCAVYAPDEFERYVDSMIGARVAQVNESWKHYVQIMLDGYELNTENP